MADAGPKPRSRLQILSPILAVAVCAFLWSALLTFDVGDWPSPHQFPHNEPAVNACGRIGAWLALWSRHYLGDGVYPLLLFATFAALTKLIRGRVGGVAERAFGVGLLVASTSVSVHLISSPHDAVLPVGNGGVIGLALGELLLKHVSGLGTLIILTACVLVGLVFATEGWVLRLPTLIGRARQAAGSSAKFTFARTGAAVPARATAHPAGPGGAAGGGPAVRRSNASVKINGLKKPSSSPGRSGKRTSDDDQRELSSEPDHRPAEAGSDDAAAQQRDRAEKPTDERTARSGGENDPPPDIKPWDADTPWDEGEPGSRPDKPVVVNFPRPHKISPPTAAYPGCIENWNLPSLSLLDDPEYSFTAQQEAVVRKKAKVLERTLEEFRLDAYVVEIDTGPVITMFELKLAAGIKVSQVASLSNDIARALKAPAIRVVAPIPGKNTVGIEVPNLEKEKVRLKELMLLSGEKAHNMALPIFIGKKASGEVLLNDLSQAPHILIAGTTGSGKSVCLNSIIVSLLMTKPPDRVKLILVDPKMVELSRFKDVPHLMCPIITDMARAEKILEWAVSKMDERYELLAEAGARHISGFNALGKEEIYERFRPRNEQERRQIPTHMPHIVIIIDELADLMMTAAKQVEHHLSRLAQKSRAVGVHIVVATQRPEAKVVTGLIKSNLPCRIAFRVASRMDSRIVLDQNGGEVLMGQGDMLFLPPGSHKLLRCQGTFVEDSEVQAVLDDLVVKGKPEFHPELTRLRSDDAEPTTERDPLFNEAVEIVLQTRRGSASLLQRRLTIGYSRASRLIDQMADAGIVGEYKGSQAREVLITPGEWKSLQKQIDDDGRLDNATVP